MDPNATLQRIKDAITAANLAPRDERGWNDDWQEAFDGLKDLHEWLKKGGFAPKVPAGTYIALGDGSKQAFSLLSLPESGPYAGGAVFIRYFFSNDSGVFEESHKFPCPGA